ncbi:hypothetical protein OIU76_030156 [Salix suchowensis]|nr:hypothetical protein OIU76_030156 [Salix suchowensis]
MVPTMKLQLQSLLFCSPRLQAKQRLVVPPVLNGWG